MNLYLLERTDDIGYDEFDSIIVAAPTEQAACAIPPDCGHWMDCRWLPKERWDEGLTLTATLVGTTHYPAGTVVHESFNAG